MENFSKKQAILVSLTLALGLGLVGCGKSPVQVINTNINQNQNVNVATSTEEIDMSGWQTYRNEEYGFEFRYPGDWKINLYKESNWFRAEIDTTSNEKVVLISNFPIGFEDARYLDVVTINNKDYERSIDGRGNFIIFGNDNKYIIYHYNKNERNIIAELVGSISF